MKITQMPDFNVQNKNKVKYKIDIKDFYTLKLLLYEKSEKALNEIIKKQIKQV